MGKMSVLIYMMIPEKITCLAVIAFVIRAIFAILVVLDEIAQSIRAAIPMLGIVT